MLRLPLFRSIVNVSQRNQFYSNVNITSLTHSLKNLAKLPPKSGCTKYLTSNVEVLESSFGPNIFRKLVYKRVFNQMRNASRNDTWQRYNRYYNSGNSNWNKLKRPAIFTVLFCVGTTLAVPYVFQYTPLAYFKRHPDYFVRGLMALNGIVFLLWKLPGAWTYLNRYALLHKDGLTSTWSMLGSAFSHQNFMHLFINMFVLQSFGTSLCATLGTSVFTVLYLNSAVLSSFASLAIPQLLRMSTSVASLGASGAIFSIFGAFSYLFPHTPIAFFFIPIPGGAWFAFIGAAAWNVAGIIARWGAYDYAAHLGGSIVGVLFAAYYKKKAQERRRRVTYF
ncbi:uncharacterized protein RJT21DRAFT_117082 [Scheffersomyces amazonensis]|uniref:uncharacterized protein n=1 Tax=Scheffersomyces amazonensis TaxID=1078765 RepID=UPI00315C6ADD